jgi:putative endonuclease
MSASSYYVYILASRHHGTFISASPTTSARGLNCTSGHGSKFVHKYKIFRLVHVEAFSNPQEAIAREKQLKFWKRDWKIKLIEEEIPIGMIGRASSDRRVMGPGFRQDDTFFVAPAPAQFAADINLSPHALA